MAQIRESNLPVSESIDDADGVRVVINGESKVISFEKFTMGLGAIGILSYPYEADTSGDTTPADGKVTWNQTTQITATRLFISLSNSSSTF